MDAEGHDRPAGPGEDVRAKDMGETEVKINPLTFYCLGDNSFAFK